MKPLRLIFLDIDGVVNSMEYEMYCEDIREGKVEGVTEVPKNEKVEMIRELCENFEVRIVISSSWRLWTLDSTLKDFEKYEDLKTLIPYIVGITPRQCHKEQGKVRGDEIDWFLKYRNYPPIEPYNSYYNFEYFMKRKHSELNYCILDDDSDMLENQMSNFINTYDNYGLTTEDINKIKQILKI